MAAGLVHDGSVGDMPTPLRVIRAVAPIRICDNGGWTDTWFARRGRVFNIAVTPYVEVEVCLYGEGVPSDPVTIHLENYGERYSFEPDALPDRYPLVEATLDEVRLPKGVCAEVSI